MSEDIDALLSALRLQAPGPGFAARTTLAFERARQAKRVRQMLALLSAAACLSAATAAGAYYAGLLNPTLFAVKGALWLADATMAVRIAHHATAAAPLLWGAVLVCMALASIATTVVLERSLRWAK